MSNMTDLLFKRAQMQTVSPQMAAPGTTSPAGPPRARVNAPGGAGGGVGQPAAGNVPTSPAAPAAGTVPTGQTAEDAQREQQVRTSIETLHTLIVAMAQSIYQMQLTEDQVKELATKMLVQLGEAVQDVTVERVRDIASDLLGEEVQKRRKRT